MPRAIVRGRRGLPRSVGAGLEYVYEPGEPMGRPIRIPYLRIMATEGGQTGNVFGAIQFNLTDEASPLSQVPGVDVGLTRIILPDGGEIMAVDRFILVERRW
ncbi:hypothetical protein AB0E27_15325 [Streptomyces sparsogenes]|uniref:hypothetical protein n=1 Tax=Streptomyces sparsogenes TaxID=67365 RepID=UPI0034069AD1